MERISAATVQFKERDLFDFERKESKKRIILVFPKGRDMDFLVQYALLTITRTAYYPFS